jgi:hypothetical protein
MDFENLLQKYRSSSVKKVEVEAVDAEVMDADVDVINGMDAMDGMDGMEPVSTTPVEPEPEPEPRKKKITVDKLVELLHKKKQEAPPAKTLEPFQVPVPDFTAPPVDTNIPDLELLYLKGSSASLPPPPPPSVTDMTTTTTTTDMLGVLGLATSEMMMSTLPPIEPVVMHATPPPPSPSFLPSTPRPSLSRPVAPVVQTVDDMIRNPAHVVDLTDTMTVKEIREKIRSEEQQRYMSRREIEEKVTRCVEISEMAEKAVKNMQQHVHRIDLHFRFLRQIMAIDDSEIESYVRDMMMIPSSTTDPLDSIGNITPLPLPLPLPQDLEVQQEEPPQEYNDTEEQEQKQEEIEEELTVPSLYHVVELQEKEPDHNVSPIVVNDAVSSPSPPPPPSPPSDTGTTKSSGFFNALRPALRKESRSSFQRLFS